MTRSDGALAFRLRCGDQPQQFKKRADPVLASIPR